MRRISASLLVALALASGCAAGDPVDGGTDDAGEGCASPCETAGETRCAGDVIEACAVSSTGCLGWTSGLDCAAEGRSCDDSSEPAVCSAGAGTCDDGAQNQDETDVDCGGIRCDACALGQGCALAADCDSRNCDTVNGICVTADTPTCTDRAQNQDETDIDCGGATCEGCGVGARCVGNDDCRSGMCNAGTCEPEPGTCTDAMQNQDETDVDCGGAACPACGVGQRCGAGSDCSTGFCDGGRCAPMSASCSDGVQNGTETDVDCGGSCGPCMDGQGCASAADCTAPYCNHNVCVQMGTCDDGARNGAESDVDCGGSDCLACPNGRECTMASDCRTGTCDSTGTMLCVNPGGPTCTDLIQNRDETDVDCGGLYCARCGDGDVCVDSTDCTSGACDLAATPHVCIPTTPSFMADEDFETGDFSRFPYAFSNMNGANDWEIETAAASCHAGAFCMRTSRIHPSTGVSAVEVPLSVRRDTTVSFWVRTDLEDAEHFFRFYVDGVMQREITGQTGWQMVSAPVTATGAGGLDRVLRFEFNRSAFVSTMHPPRFEVWIDDIDMPEWNTPPTVPELVTPTNGQLTTDTTPTFGWRSFDADFDPITYEMQWDTDPSFPAPMTTGETNMTTFTPTAALTDGIYYWRVRSKDNSDFRWSAWSEPNALEVLSTHEYPNVWRQTEDDQFLMNELLGVTVAGDAVAPTSGMIHVTGSSTVAFNGATRTVTTGAMPTGGLVINGSLRVTAQADFDSGCSSNECASVRIDGTTIGTHDPRTCGTASSTFAVSDVGRFVDDGSVQIGFTTRSGVDSGGCSGLSNTWSFDLSYALPSSGAQMTSVPIHFSTFGGALFWEKVHVVGTGTIRIQVLDDAGALIPDTVLPGNSTGNTARTIQLWYVDPMVYPTIRLRALLDTGAQLEEWSVVGNDVYEWTFERDGDAEGWAVEDTGATPTMTVSGGALRLDTLAAGTDARVTYAVPRDTGNPMSGIDARRFTRMLVRVRTSNAYSNDDVTLFWSNNFGGVDTRRSFTEPGVFLGAAYQDVVIDLTQMPMAPNEPWRGTIYGLRIDPVVDFLDATLAPSDGWFEIDRITLF